MISVQALEFLNKKLKSMTVIQQNFLYDDEETKKIWWESLGNITDGQKKYIWALIYKNDTEKLIEVLSEIGLQRRFVPRETL